MIVVNHFLKKHYLGHRNSGAVIIAELIKHSGKDKTFLNKLIQNILPRVADNEPRVRRQGLVGLGNLQRVWYVSLFFTLYFTMSFMSCIDRVL